MFAIKLDKNNTPKVLGLKTAPLSEKKKNSLERDLRKLNRLYKEIPRPECDRCGGCCDGTKTGNPRVYSIEFLAIMRLLSSPSNRELRKKMFAVSMMNKFLMGKRMKEEYKAMEKPGYREKSYWSVTCPAVDPETKLCLIYEQRPIICRLYGLNRWYKDDKGWIDQKVRVGCDQVKISPRDRTATWNYRTRKSLLERLEQLSRYYYLIETENRIFNSISMMEWFTLHSNCQGVLTN
ncbi:MAG: YkgJ family cysteine cluster protein [bacterium]